MGKDDLPARLAEKVAINERGCWIWTAARDPNGYGRVTRCDGGRKRTNLAHRYVYELLVGDPGPVLDHLCRVTSCVNPDHLEPVTNAENIRRGVAAEALRKFWGDPSRRCPAGHPYAGDNLYVYITKNGHPNRQCRTCRAETNRRRRARLANAVIAGPANHETQPLQRRMRVEDGRPQSA
jgi:hypothetical protein